LAATTQRMIRKAAEDVSSTVGTKHLKAIVRRTESWQDTAKIEFRRWGLIQESSGNFAILDAERVAGQVRDSKQLAVENRRCHRDCEWSSIRSIVALVNQTNGRFEFHRVNSSDEEIRSKGRILQATESRRDETKTERSTWLSVEKTSTHRRRIP